MRTLPTVLLLFTCLAMFTVTPRAQISRVAGTGCASASYPVPSPTSARIATTVTFTGRLCAGRMPGFFMLGVAPLRATIQPPVTCGSCVLGLVPLIYLTSARVAVPVPIPNDRRLIGACFYVQTGCITVRQCFDLDGTLKVCIQ